MTIDSLLLQMWSVRRENPLATRETVILGIPGNINSEEEEKEEKEEKEKEEEEEMITRINRTRKVST